MKYVLCAAVIILSQMTLAIEQHPDIDKEYAAIFSRLPPSAQLIYIPYIDILRSYGKGLKKKINADPSAIGERSLNVNVKRKGRHAGDKGINATIVGPIEKGDYLVVVAWLRAERVASGGDASIPVTVQKASEPFSSVIEGVFTVTSEWQRHVLTGVSGMGFKAQESQLGFQLGGDKQVIKFGPVYVFNLGDETLNDVNDIKYAK